LTIKQKSIVLLSIIMLLLVIMSNCMQKSTVNNGHSHHYVHDSLFYIYKHVHSQSTHSHYHSTNISMLDYFYISDKNNNISNIEKVNDIFKLSIPYLNDLIKELFKPPKFS